MSDKKNTQWHDYIFINCHIYGPASGQLQQL